MKRSRLFVVPIVAALILAGCGSDGGSTADSDPNPKVTVYTIPPLKSVVTEVVDRYKKENPDAEVSISAENRANAIGAIKNKQTAIVVLPQHTLDQVRGSLPHAGFGRNLLVIAVPADNPGNITTMQSYWSNDIRRGSCVVFVPPDCRTKVLKQLTDGDLDAALMFRGDLAAPKQLKVITLPDQPNLVVPFGYAISAPTPAALALGKYMGSGQAQSVLAANGYLP